MKGMIFILVQDFIKETFGDEIYYEIMDRSKLQTKDPFVYPGTYPDGDLIEMVVKAAEVLKISVMTPYLPLGHTLLALCTPVIPSFLTSLTTERLLKTVDGVITWKYASS